MLTQSAPNSKNVLSKKDVKQALYWSIDGVLSVQPKRNPGTWVVTVALLNGESAKQITEKIVNSFCEPVEIQGIDYLSPHSPVMAYHIWIGTNDQN